MLFGRLSDHLGDTLGDLGGTLGAWGGHFGNLWDSLGSLWEPWELFGVTFGRLELTLAALGALGPLLNDFRSRVEDFFKNKRASRSLAKTGFFRGSKHCAGVCFEAFPGKLGFQNSVWTAQACVLETFLFF